MLPMHTVLEENLKLYHYFPHLSAKNLSDTVIDFCKEWVYFFFSSLVFLIIYCV